MAIQRFAQRTSTATIWLKRASLTSKTSFMAVWLAPPPIQLPATVVRPRQTASGPPPPTVSGLTAPTAMSATGPPTMIPTVPVRNMAMAFHPSRMMAGRSTERVRRTSVAGRR